MGLILTYSYRLATMPAWGWTYSQKLFCPQRSALPTVSYPQEEV